MYLNCKTRLSYRYGTLSTEALVQLAKELGVKALALTNINSTADVWDFVDFCRSAEIKPILGAEIRNGSEILYILLAKTDQSLLAINRFISEHLWHKKAFPEKPDLSNDVFIIYPFGKINPTLLAAHEFIGIKPEEVNRLYRFKPSELAAHFVIRQPVTFKDKMGYNIHRLLRAIDKNTLLSKQDPRDIASPSEYFIPPTALLKAFEQFPEIISNSLQIIDSCACSLPLHSSKNRAHFTFSEKQDNELLKNLTLKGLKVRYGTQHEEALRRIEKEMTIIQEVKFTSSFLIAWDIVQFAKKKGFFHIGRGSSANSIVAYCLGITDVDPIELDLYFERFLNPSRTSPPDFDLDFSWNERDAVINYVFEKYGHEHVALLGMFSTFKRKAAIRELGKVFGLPTDEIESLIKFPDGKNDKVHRQILKYADLLQSIPNHLSIHAGGILISEKPIYQYLATERPPKGFATAQIDMFLAEKVGLFKFDVLSQRGLGHIREAIRLVKETQEIAIDIHDIKKLLKDKRIAKNIQEGNTIGCFYIESPAMRQLLKKLQCKDYLTLVAASSIIRPGVAKSGMMRQFVYYHNHPDEVKYLHPRLKDLLAETYGVMVYQEDVIKVAHHFAGLSRADADILRRAMSGKYRSKNHFQLIRRQFFDNCKQKGYSAALSSEVWRQMESFAGYSFSKAHSASYAVESYQSLYLKTYFPVEFMVAVINNFGGFYSTELYFQELKKTGVTLLPPCVNHSDYYTNIKEGKVYVGFIHLLSLEKKTAKILIEERHKNGLFQNLNDFIERTGLAAEQLNMLIKIGGFRFTGRPKKVLLWEANFLQKGNKHQKTTQFKLFNEKPHHFRLPELPQHPGEDVIQEIEHIGFPLCDVFDLVDDNPEKYTAAKDLPLFKEKMVTVLGYYVTRKIVRTIKKEMMYFGTFRDVEGNWIDTVHFPNTAKQYPFRGHGFYRITGKVVEEFGVFSLEVVKMEKVGLKSVK